MVFKPVTYANAKKYNDPKVPVFCGNFLSFYKRKENFCFFFFNLSRGFAHKSASNLSPALERLLNCFVCLPGYSVRELFRLSQFKLKHQCTYLELCCLRSYFPVVWIEKQPGQFKLKNSVE